MPPPREEHALVTVIVPAYNEERVIATTVSGILASTYRNLEILVIDDGSQDGTLAVLNEQFHGNERVQILGIPNGGKANALIIEAHARAWRSGRGAGCGCTQFERDTIARLVR